MKFSKRFKKFGAFLATWALVASLVTYIETSDETSKLKERIDDFENVLFDFLSVAKFALEPEADDESAAYIAEEYKERRIVLVDIDESSMEALGNYNLWPRSHHAKVIDQLARGGAASITFDILMKTADWGKRDTEAAINILKEISPETPWNQLRPAIQSGFNYDSLLLQSVSNASRVITSATVGRREEYADEERIWKAKTLPSWIQANSPHSSLPLPQDLQLDSSVHMEILDNTFPEFSNSGYKMGLVNVIPDLDGIHRSEPLMFAYPNEDLSPGVSTSLYPVISLQTALMLMQIQPSDIIIKQGQEIIIGQPFGLYQDSSGQIQTTYPLLSWTAIKSLIAHKDTIQQAQSEVTKNHRIEIANTLNFQPSPEGLIGNILHAQNLSPAMVQTIQESPDFFKVAYDIQAQGDSITSSNPAPPQDAPGAIQVAAFNDSVLIGYYLEEKKVALLDFDGQSIDEDEWIYLDAYTLETLEYFQSDIQALKPNKVTYFSIPLEVYSKGGVLSSSITLMGEHVLKDLLSQDIQELEKQISNGDTLRFGDTIKIPVWGNENRMMINFLGLDPSKDNHIFQRISYSDLVNQTVDVASFQGKIFVLGSTAPALFDMVAAPGVPNFPGVELHLNMLHNILTNNFLTKVEQFDILFIIILFAFLATLISTYLSPIWSAIIIALISVGYFIFNFQLFHYGEYYGIVKPQLALILGFGFTLIYKFTFEEREKRQAVEAFKNYISPELIDQMLESDEKPTLGGEMRYLTAYFTDIASFSTFSEQLNDPTRLVELLNEYLTHMTDILTESGGTLDKYEGDAIIAFFGAPVEIPNNAYSACYTAIKMQKRLGVLREKWASEGDKWPVIVHHMRMRIGLNSGQIVTGNMGSKMRMNYTMMGDAVNLAARLESGAKQYGVFTMCSKETLDASLKDRLIEGQAVNEEPKMDLLYREIDKVRVVGKSEPVEIYELLNFKAEASEAEFELVKLFQKALNEYRSCQWESAKDLFTQCLALEPHHPEREAGCKTTPSHVFIERCELYAQNPPTEDLNSWDGVYTATEK